MPRDPDQSDERRPAAQAIGEGDTVMATPADDLAALPTDYVATPAEVPAARRQRPALPERGNTLGRFVVLDLLGQGGFGVVLAAYDPDLDRKVALKLIQPTLFLAVGADDARQRLLREARALARLSHPNVVAVHEIGTLDDAVFIAMEFVPGQTLRAWLRERPPRERVLEVFAAAGRGLAAAHRAGIVHRDFKPDNVMIAADGRVRVLDFGLARAGGESHPPRSGAPLPRPRDDGDSLSVEITQAGAVLGTPAYMAPEQHRGQPADARSDQFAFCVALYEALYGARPFPGNSVSAVADAVTRGELTPPPPGSGVPPSIERALLRGLATEPGDRHPSMEALLEHLERTPRREAEDLLVGSWDDDVRRAVHDALAAVGAEAVATRVCERLDAYAAAWIQAYAAAREAQDSGASGRAHTRTAWLLARVDELAALAEVLAGADATIADHATEACQRLPSLDADARATAEPEPPRSSELRAQVTRQRMRLGRARSLADTGKYERALAEARAVLSETEAIDYPPIAAEAMAATGELAARAGDTAAAEPLLVDATMAADACGHDALRVRAMTQLIAVVGDAMARPDDGERWARMAAAAAHRTGDDPLTAGRIRLARARVSIRGGQYPRARDEARAAADTIAAAHGTGDHPEVAEALTALGDALRELGDWPAAEAALARALEVRERLLGRGHPHLAQSLSALGVLQAARGAYAEALGYHQRAVAVAEAALAPDHAALAGYLEYLGEAYTLLGRHADAIAPLERALAARERALGPDHPDIANALTQLGRTMRAMGRFEDARAAYQRALDVRVAALGDDHPEVAACENNLGMALMSLGDHAGAREHHGRALAIREARLGPTHPTTANSLTNVGRACVALGRLDEAEDALGRAVAIWEATGHHFLSYALHALGNARQARGDTTGALDYYRRALAIREAALGADHPTVAEILRDLLVAQESAGLDADAATTRARLG